MIVKSLNKIQFPHNEKIDVQIPFKLCITADTFVLINTSYWFWSPKTPGLYWERFIAWKCDVVGQVATLGAETIFCDLYAFLL